MQVINSEMFIRLRYIFDVFRKEHNRVFVVSIDAVTGLYSDIFYNTIQLDRIVITEPGVFSSISGLSQVGG